MEGGGGRALRNNSGGEYSIDRFLGLADDSGIKEPKRAGVLCSLGLGG